MSIEDIRRRHNRGCYGGNADAAYRQAHIDRGVLLQEVESLRDRWLTEQQARLEQTDLVETWGAVKARAENKRLRRLIHEAMHKLTCTAIERSANSTPEIVRVCDNQAIVSLQEALQPTEERRETDE